MKRNFIHRLALLLILLTTWYVLSGVNSWLFAGFALASSLFAIIMACRMDVMDREGQPLHLSIAAPFYWLWLFKEMMLSSFAVTRIVWSKKMAISPKMEWLPLTQKDDLGRTIYANSITLTPGTVCVDVEESEVLVHALETSSLEDLKAGEMDRRVSALKTNLENG